MKHDLVFSQRRIQRPQSSRVSCMAQQHTVKQAVHEYSLVSHFMAII